ncbi:hypothetical protein [Nocardiopsis alba]|uniref:hypothetical protein n=1 Tax=Nocardiopsis alba TaxID=53437 RepID=UPI000348B28F|nr:hypothetical protein [Nocardiopsis alba]
MPPIDTIRPSHNETAGQSQFGVDPDPDLLVYPPAIPRPTTLVENLQAAIDLMRSSAGSVSEGGQGIKSTWGGLQAHYTAPESETLFSAMDRVAECGDDIESDVSAAVTALETFAEAAQSAKEELGAIRDEAWEFREEMQAEEAWNENPANTLRNHIIKLRANKAWGEYQDAERECASSLSSINGGNSVYVAAGEDPPGENEIVYGIDAADVPDPNFDMTSLGDWKRIHEFGWNYLRDGNKPVEVAWAADSYMATWDNFGGGMVWGLGVNAVASTGLWREGSGWAGSASEVRDNAGAHLKDTIKGYAALAGLYGSSGSLIGEGDFTMDTWKSNMGESWKEVAHDLVPWREWDDRPAYTVTTAGGNLALAVVGLPARAGMLGAKLSTGSHLPDVDAGSNGANGSSPVGHGSPGAAARPGFNLADTFDALRTDVDGTVDRVGRRLNELTGRLGELTSRWSAPTSGSPHGPVSPSADGTGTASVNGGSTGSGTGGDLRDDRAPDRNTPTRRADDDFEERSVRELSEEIDRYSAMNADERARLLERERALVLSGGGGMEIPGPDGLGRRGGGHDFGPRAFSDTERGETRIPAQSQEGRSGGVTTVLDREDARSEGTGTLGHGGTEAGPYLGGGGGGGGDRPDGPSPSGGDDGPGGPGPKNLEEFERHRWGDKNDPKAEEAFFRDIEYLLNNDEAFRKEYYKENLHRISKDTKIGMEGWQLPKVHIDSNGRNIPLRQPDAPDYFGDKTRVRIGSSDFFKGPDGKPLTGDELARRQKLKDDFAGIDHFAQDRREKLDEARRLEKIYEQEAKKHGKYVENGNNHPDVERAYREKADAQRDATDAAELLGEKSADIGARYEFDGEPLRDKNGEVVMREVRDAEGNPVRDEHGNIRREEVRKPNLDGATLLGQASGAPGNGNGQFDLIYETKDGEIVIIEAKASTNTKLGTRVYSPEEGRPRDTYQGTADYVRSILDAMRGRSNSSVEVGDGSQIPGVRKGEGGVGDFVSESALARYISMKLNQGKVSYAVFKGNPSGWGSGGDVADGYDYQIFDLKG